MQASEKGYSRVESFQVTEDKEQKYFWLNGENRKSMCIRYKILQFWAGIQRDRKWLQFGFQRHVWTTKIVKKNQCLKI